MGTKKKIADRFSRMGPGLTSSMTALIAGAALLTAIMAGLDYIASPVDKIMLSIVETAVPLDVWGIYMIAAAVAAIFGWVTGRWWLTILGHAALIGIYMAFGTGVIMQVLNSEDWFGWRTGTNRFCLALINFVLAKVAWQNWDLSREWKRAQKRAQSKPKSQSGDDLE